MATKLHFGEHADWDLTHHPFWSNRKVNVLLNKRRIVIPWPEDKLGAYGSNSTSDDDLDRYVEELIGHPKGEVIFRGITGWGNPEFVFCSAIPGRTKDLRPVISIGFMPF